MASLFNGHPSAPQWLEEAVASCRDATLHWVEGAGHAFETTGRRIPAAESAAALAPVVVDWMRARA